MLGLFIFFSLSVAWNWKNHISNRVSASGPLAGIRNPVVKGSCVGLPAQSCLVQMDAHGLLSASR